MVKGVGRTHYRKTAYFFLWLDTQKYKISDLNSNSSRGFALTFLQIHLGKKQSPHLLWVKQQGRLDILIVFGNDDNIRTTLNVALVGHMIKLWLRPVQLSCSIDFRVVCGWWKSELGLNRKVGWKRGAILKKRNQFRVATAVMMIDGTSSVFLNSTSTIFLFSTIFIALVCETIF